MRGEGWETRLTRAPNAAMPQPKSECKMQNAKCKMQNANLRRPENNRRSSVFRDDNLHFSICTLHFAISQRCARHARITPRKTLLHNPPDDLTHFP